jgi:hypothetical protein
LEAGAVTVQADTRVAIGDCWEALDAAGTRPAGLGLGSAYFTLSDGHLKMPSRTFVDHGAASDQLLAVLASWGVHPTASGKYPPPSGTDAQFAALRFGWVAQQPAPG